ncbi:glycosyltransferase family protein [Leptospira santarosai]|uniref:surface carbohydrate biosynthesis protein n=1 Tax=Leptospira santarosai TaxID=28183 RepID=UPI000964DA83|nr:surface carbohydrate biosynthesis protein [Leptospira santarosai]ASV13143.1 surface carbohydrate biosynthesis protein [Leptospira santarosai]MBW9232606.1 surface carbohydrate biosynthesis protein [Leptospira santarosai]MDI7174375.1 surface carbohydrate biosynthesis protein [Leptospira santarosai]MDI7193708.1 surface carbohydrate biosynthesis protein [Leptospira santarosai]MDO6382052.1 surface carbohydrate biosynthesis protein [Leptospira santarosai]
MYNLVFNSFSSKTVLIQCDHKRRDSASSFLIAFYLKKLGYNVVLGSRLTSKSLYFLLKPELVLLTHPNSLFMPKEMEEAAKYTRFTLLHPESSGMVKHAMIDHMRGGRTSIGDSYSKNISQVFTWGTLLRDWIVEAQLYRSENVESIGCPRYDFYIGKDKNHPSGRLGIMSTFTGITTFDNRNVFQLLDQGRGLGGVYYGKKGGYEDFFWASAAFARVYLEFLDIWCLDLKMPVNFRSYTLENFNDIKYFNQKYKPHLELDDGTPFPKWLQDRGGNIFCYSSSIIESIISGVPYISVQGIIEDRLEFHLPRKELTDIRGEIYNYTYKPQSIEELVELAKKAYTGNLPLKVSPDGSAKLKKLLSDYYGYPKEEPSSWILAKRIDALIRDKKKNNQSFNLSRFKDYARSCYNVSQHLKPKMFKTLNDYHLMPWDKKDRMYAEEHFNTLEGITKS